MGPDLSNESSGSVTRVTMRVLQPEAYLAQHTAVPVTSPMVRCTKRAIASLSMNSEDLNRVPGVTFTYKPL